MTNKYICRIRDIYKSKIKSAYHGEHKSHDILIVKELPIQCCRICNMKQKITKHKRLKGILITNCVYQTRNLEGLFKKKCCPNSAIILSEFVPVMFAFDHHVALYSVFFTQIRYYSSLSIYLKSSLLSSVV